MPTKQSSGLYRTKVVIGHDDSGKPINKWVSARTKKELERKKAEVVDKYINGNRTLTNITFGAFAKEWYLVKKKPFLARGTQILYESILNHHLLPRFRDIPMRSITAADIQTYITGLSALSVSRVSSIRNLITAIFGNAFSEGYILNNPASRIRVSGQEEKQKYILTPADRARIESVCATHEDGILLALLYYTGMRDGELCALKWGDITRDIIHIHGSLKHDNGMYIGPTKTASSVRDIPIPAPLHEILESQRSPDDYFVIRPRDKNSPLNAAHLKYRWARLMQACDLGYPEEICRGIHWHAALTPHGMRHNYTTMLYEAGVDPYTAAKLLGHSSINTTMNIYTHFSQTAMVNASAQLNEIFSKKEKVAQT